MKRKIKTTIQKIHLRPRKSLGRALVPRALLRAEAEQGGSHNITFIAIMARRVRRAVSWIWATPLRRVVAILLLVVTVWGAAVVPISGYLVDQHYLLSSSTRQLLGSVNSTIADKLTYDSQDRAYYLNRDGITLDVTTIQDASDPKEVARQLQRQKIGGSDIKRAEDLLYSAKISSDPKEGVVFYENNLNVSFRIAPKMRLMGGRVVDGHVVFPQTKTSQLIYSAKGNGIKEDIILQQAPQQPLDIAYDLDLPETLAARLLEDGSIGIYSADPAYFGKNMNFSSDQEREVIVSARKSGEKTNLVFVIPAPTVVSASGNIGKAKASFVLSKDQKLLTVQTEALQTASYPLSIDPSMVITSTSDFTSKLGSADNIDFSTADQIKRGGLTGGSTGAWTSATNNFSTGRFGHTSVAYNGYLYVMGGNNMGSYLNDTQYTALNASDGTLGTWTNSANTFATPRLGLASVAYNGYLYILGGIGSAGSVADVQYSRINSNGSLNTWATTTSLPAARYYHAAVAYNGYIYVIGGDTGTRQNDVLYMPILANGSLSSSWTATSSFTTARRLHTAVAYNSYLYILGGDSGS